MIHVEQGVEFANDYGDIDDRFYDNIYNAYEKLNKFIQKNNIQNHFKERCHNIVKNTRQISWGFGDEIADCYYEFFED